MPSCPRFENSGGQLGPQPEGRSQAQDCETKLPKAIRSIFLKKWPVELVSCEKEPNFIFLLTLPNSGSTAISKVFRSSPKVDALRDNGEGQWLIKGMCEKDRWEKDKAINAQSVRSVWLKTCQAIQEEHPQVEFFIEKSPPNMMRIDLIRELFPNHVMIANNRDPYANVSSIFHRYQKPKEIEAFSADRRKAKMQRIARTWVERSEILRELILEHDIPLLTYEQFCNEPRTLQDILKGIPFTQSIELDFKSSFKVKDYEMQGVVNFNAKQMANLTPKDIADINEILAPHEETLAFFGYELLAAELEVA
ncbi:sulfotransferase family protein [Novosphingobium mangrovi (ex Hu et al. 2023)]|uniref:Sulfotransferase n=1 Tax=Novosphingobium mangrovi (ex Hu et al. 2023) TaxID=2930094 RepID=A0ABT0ACR9_9SPHN|nr:sulfotransferase [Novosphingobium mangrovi (ex Hu et al. 2023)]MCJ1960974.1 sulfotransferase [Novosphingobium mangrovi (ex Hu et al. 2023)]